MALAQLHNWCHAREQLPAGLQLQPMQHVLIANTCSHMFLRLTCTNACSCQLQLCTRPLPILSLLLLYKQRSAALRCGK
jgi:hypothetical protein